VVDQGLLMPVRMVGGDSNLGLNLGWTFGNAARPASNMGYAELQFSRYLAYALAAGWAWDPLRGRHGPQVTGSVGFLFLRTTTMLNEGTSVEAGVVFKLPVLSVTQRR
jgi:hypothetical protein